MRKYSDAVTQMLSRKDTLAHFLVALIREPNALSSVPAIRVFDTTAPYDIYLTWIAQEPFVHNSGLMVVEAPRIAKSVDRQAYKIAYIDPNFLLREHFEAGLTGTQIVVALAFVNTSPNTINQVPTGGVFTAEEDIVIVYAGLIDNQSYAINPEEGSVVAVIEGASPIAALSMSKPVYTSKEYIRQKDALDSSFDAVNINSSGHLLLWGKAPKT